ncbi:PEP-CTERM sorting domain-containing protein [Luteolibacter pohnpeiensis]|uniref:PEP-CTERM sorting domain-containing protein n=1 Tax=Luteolibacter pohnpeiensis TaxID=454153 RepID=A0A934S747_9BACT|nr:PEP-CTERM sorting domain-containing protein [Luteolibacter pohnpeiensis]MBK1884305.1 PEP-CTERM sorting domain-containing protein [Luteolibacter pohnpeiensis]
MTSNKKSIATFIASAALLTAAANAAVITWGSVEDTTGISVVSTNGTLVSAYNGGASSVVINGDTWVANNVLGSLQASMMGGGTTDDTDFTTLLTQATFGGGSGQTSIDLGTFVVGRTYEIQIFFVDQRTTSTGLNDRVMAYSSTDSTGAIGDTVLLEADPNNSLDSPYGQYVIGTFTADGSDPDLVLQPYLASFGNSHIAAWQIRDITAVPEPSGVALLSFSAFALAFIRRVKR